MMLECLGDREKTNLWWFPNGGFATINSYLEVGAQSSLIDHCRWLEKLPVYHKDRYRIFVHAWIDNSLLMSRQIKKKMQWAMYPNDFDEIYLCRNKKMHIVHGHHQHVHGPLIYKNRSNLDVLAWMAGRLVVGVVDDNKSGGPIDIMEVFGVNASQTAALTYKLGDIGKEN